jgi:hypothetical protein
MAFHREGEDRFFGDGELLLIVMLLLLMVIAFAVT